MKKTFSLTLLTLFLMFFMLISIGGVGVSAYTYNPGESGLDFTSYKDDIVFCGVDLEADIHSGPWLLAGKNPIHGWDGNIVLVYIKEIEPGEESFQFNINTDFSPLLESEIRGRLEGSPYASIGSFIKTEYGRDGMYWNPWLQLWQLEYPVEPEEFDGNAVDWFNHISQFEYGFAQAEIYQTSEDFGLLIVEEPFHEFEGCIFEYSRSHDSEYWIYFEPWLRNALKTELLYDPTQNIVELIEGWYGEDFDGFLYWNFEEGYWQVSYYGTTELDYYKQRVDDLEDEISSLENQISLLEDEISSLENQISSLENENSLLQDEIQQL